ncbi:MAG: sugar phosphate isomerase/epimerase [Planctomycetota bacterium]|nr:MAG: sugar phosphate isomerase/epimerase [Planctomycetota bacterium]
MHASWSRRKFLAAAASAVLVAPRLARAAVSESYGGFNLGLQSYSLRQFPVDEMLAEVNKLGLGGVELFNAHFPLQSSDADIEAMKKKTEALGIQMLGHGVNPFTADHEANRRWFEFAKKSGIKNLSADPTEDAFDSLDKLCEEYQIRIAIHNHGPGARYDKVADTLNVIRDRHPLIGACADLGHYIRSAEDPVRAIHLFKGRLYGIHLKDFAAQKAKTEGVIIGQGHLDVVSVFKALKAVEFPTDGCFVLEYEENPKAPLDDIRQCLAVAREAAAQAAS